MLWNSKTGVVLRKISTGTVSLNGLRGIEPRRTSLVVIHTMATISVSSPSFAFYCRLCTDPRIDSCFIWRVDEENFWICLFRVGQVGRNHLLVSSAIHTQPVPSIGRKGEKKRRHKMDPPGGFEPRPVSPGSRPLAHRVSS